MNRTEMIAALDEVLSKKGDVYIPARRPPGLPPSVGLPPDLNPELTEPVISALGNQDEFRDSPGFMVQRENGYSAFRPDIIAPKLVVRARENGSDAAVDWLEMVLNTDEAESLSVAALWGVTTKKPLSISDGVELVPFDDLPPSYAKDLLQNPLSSGRAFIPAPITLGAPKAALITRSTITPFLVNLRNGKPPKQAAPLKNQELLDEIRLCLTVVGPCAPLVAAHWSQFENEGLETAALGGGFGIPDTESIPRMVEESDDIDGDLARAMVEGYFTLGNKFRNKVRIALDRLNQAIRRKKLGDKAVELAIAFEVLLVDDRGDNRFKVGLRASQLLGGELDQRHRNRAMVRGVYDVRSALLHDGMTKKSFSVPGVGATATKDVIREGTEVCAAVIRSIIDRREIPDWSVFDLTGGR